MISDYFLLSLKNLKKRGLRSWLTMLGIFLGIAAVVSLISLGSGLQQAITGQFSTLDADKLVVENIGTGFGPPGSTVVTKLTNKDLELVEETAGVKLAVKRYIRSARFEYNGVVQFNGVSSLPDQQEELQLVYDFFNAEILTGKLLKTEDRGAVLLGYHFLEHDFGKKLAPGKTVIIQGQKFEIAGILKKSS